MRSSVSSWSPRARRVLPPSFTTRPGFAGLDVATIFCGGNLTPGQIRDWLQPA